MSQIFLICSIYVLCTCLSPSVRAQDAEDFIFVQIPSEADPGLTTKNNEQSFKDRYVPGARIVAWNLSKSEPVNLTPDFLAACDPDVSFDGKSIIFAGKEKASEFWQIWRMNPDGSEKEQITQSQSDCYAPLHAGNRFYLNDPQPTRQIIYVGNEHSATDFALYGMDTQGKIVHRLTFNLYNEFLPDVLSNGRILFSSWQKYVNTKSSAGRLSLFAINNDGTDLMPFYGNHEHPVIKEMVHVSDYDDRIYFIESDRPVWLGGGNITSLSQRRPLHSYRKISDDQKGFYHSPCPLPEGALLASYRDQSKNSVYAIYVIDSETGERKKKLFEQLGWHSIDTQILTSHQVVRGRSNWLIPGSTTGVFYCLNIYRTNLEDGMNIPAGSIKYVRIIEGLSRSNKSGLHSESAAETKLSRNESRSVNCRVLGVAPVEKDGSFHVRVPAKIPLTFQILDENQIALQSQNSWTWVMGNENRGCIGCHEDRELSPPNSFVDALIKPPVELTTAPGQRRTVDFINQIAPLMDSKCFISGCHVSGDIFRNLAGIENLSDSKTYNSYFNKLFNPVKSKTIKKYIVPGQAKNSSLIWHLLGDRMQAKSMATMKKVSQPASTHSAIKSEYIISFIEWIDLGAQWNIVP